MSRTIQAVAKQVAVQPLYHGVKISYLQTLISCLTATRCCQWSLGHSSPRHCDITSPWSQNYFPTNPSSTSFGWKCLPFRWSKLQRTMWLLQEMDLLKLPTSPVAIKLDCVFLMLVGSCNTPCKTRLAVFAVNDTGTRIYMYIIMCH